MRGDQAAAGRQARLSPPPSLLLLLLQLSRAAALHPGELFPYGQSRGDQLLQEGDDESSAAVKLASPLRFYEAQFSYLYVSSASCRCGIRQISRSSFPEGLCSVDRMKTRSSEGRKLSARPVVR